ncbi:DUF1990 family protein [Glaciibacter superstes]|uniref:DUF1990 family protein n=1 Tax=Glaciibacter superstes TaxID=501023 RepID=UPI0003B4D347|nr:DUF1990 family protein [Glaciibacter superstes]
MTSPELADWHTRDDDGFRRSEASAFIGNGGAAWERAARGVLLWRVKTASGFTVDTAAPAATGDRVTVTTRVFGVTIVEPVEVVSVVDTPVMVGFSYRTLPGHPVDGEEAFIVHRIGDDVYLTVRSLTRAAQEQPWRALYPLLRVAQLVARRRYLRALR